MRDADFQNLIASIKEAGAIRRGEMKPSRVFEFKPDDVRRVRRRLRQTQSEFAFMIGVSVGTLRNWEQGRRVPEGPARALLRVASKNPDVVRRSLSAR
jgi:putative transcriptional regulator